MLLYTNLVLPFLKENANAIVSHIGLLKVVYSWSKYYGVLQSNQVVEYLLLYIFLQIVVFFKMLLFRIELWLTGIGLVSSYNCLHKEVYLYQAEDDYSEEIQPDEVTRNSVVFGGSTFSPTTQTNELYCLVGDPGASTSEPVKPSGTSLVVNSPDDTKHKVLLACMRQVQ